MVDLKVQFNDFEKSVIQIQDHALEVNNLKNQGISEIPIDSYMSLIDSFINWMHQIESYFNESESQITNQKEQIDKLLDLVNINKTNTIS